MERKANGSFDTAGVAVLEREAGVRAVEMRESIANVGKADAAGGSFVRRSGQASAGVRNSEDHAAVVAMGGDGELHGFVAGLHAVPQGIFDERLKDELRHEGREQGRINVVGDRKFAFEPLLHELEIAAGDLKLLFERELVRAGAAQCEAKEIAELREHGVGGADVFVHDGGDGVERVEEKMRLNLEAEIFKLGLRETSLKFGGGELLGLRDFEALVEIVKHDDDGEPDEVVRILHRITKTHDAVIVGAHTEERSESPSADGHHRGVNGGICGGAKKMKTDASEPGA